MDINSKTVTFGNKVIQTRNISEASSWQNNAGKPGCFPYGFAALFILAGLNGFAMTAQAGLGGTGIAAAIICIAIGGYIIWMCTKWRPTYELQIQTNAGRETALASKDSAFIDQILGRLHRAMAEPQSATNYHVNVDAKTIQENRIDVSHSAGVNVIGGNAQESPQSAAVSGATIAEVSELIELVRASQADNRDELRGLLEDVRNHLAGGAKSKEEAKTSWQRFVQGMGTLSDIGGNLWSLVSKVSAALG